MAPIKRPTAKAKASRSATARNTTPAGLNDKRGERLNSKVEDRTSPFEGFAATKEDKRRIKHHALIGRIAKTAPGQKAHMKRRRPNKKLKADLEGLLGALPQVEGTGVSQTGQANVRPVSMLHLSGVGDTVQGKMSGPAGKARETTMEMKSMRSRPGATKRKAKLEISERDRFARNMAQLAGGGGQDSQLSSVDKFTALRRFIVQTRQQEGAFTSS